MSRPDFENIDKWLFEFSEGNLTDEQETQLFDFLEQNPELMSEVKAWSNAKVKAPTNTGFSSEHLIKPTPILLRPLSLMSIALLTILSGWYTYSLFPTAPLYSKTTIDAEIITAELEQTDDFFNQLLVSTNSQSNNSPTKKGSFSIVSNTSDLARKESLFKEELSHKKSNSNIEKSELILLNNTEKAYNSSEPKSDFANFVAKNKDNIKDELVEESLSSVKAKDLGIISKYLKCKNTSNESKEALSKKVNSKNIASNRSSKSTKSKTSKSSLKKTVSSTFRKIKRMADYPVAMQNTKNPNFHAPSMTGYKANIAMVGSAPGDRIQATSRMQWPSESNGQIMNTLSFDKYVYALRGGLGVDVNYNNYQNNDLSNYSLGLTYSPKFSINKKISFEPAMRIKIGVINLDQKANSIGNKIEFDRTNVIPLFTEENEAIGSQLWYRDMGLGFMINTEWFYAGLNADNIGGHYNNYYSSDLNKEYKSDIHYTAIMGTEYVAKSRNMRISAYALFQKYGNLNEMWLGSNFQYNWMQIGIGVSSNADIAASIGMIFKQFSLHYNIDYTESRLLHQQNISHQVSMRFLLKPKRNVSKFLKF